MQKETTFVAGMYENWFLEYASYVILERAIPALEDGFKPVQRRILHAMKQMDDGRYNKVANVIGQAMQYHPHGDASITDAMVNIGQKDLLIDTQGNWGDIRTGDSAAAARYIEARLTKFALEVVFNADTTEWQMSYDGRKKEPVNFPVKFPLLLAQGVEGIAVGLSTKILPHNFCELIEASIEILKGNDVQILPDFLVGGIMDASAYNNGRKGSKVRVRAKIEEIDKKTLAIREIPFGTTTTSIIDSILKAVENGKIKIKNVVDNTAKDVEILINLQAGISPEITIDALYAVTDCEISISPNACVIVGDKPMFLGVDEILKTSTLQTKAFLEKELEILKLDLQEKILYSSLEKIFIENKIYRKIEEAETWEMVLKMIEEGLSPFKSEFFRDLTIEDFTKLTEIKIKRISKFDAFKADEQMRKFQQELKETQDNLDNITRFSIAYFRDLMKKYGKNRERKTEITTFSSIQAAKVVANNTKLYVNKEEGFVGFGLKKDVFVCDCSDIDDVIVFRADGKFIVTKIADKTFVGKEILHVAVFNKDDKRMVYNMIYRDGATGSSFVKRFQVFGITRDKENDLTKGTAKSKVLYFTANANAEAEIVTSYLTANCTAKNKTLEYNFYELDIKGRNSMGNILTKYPIRKIEKTSNGVSTLGKLKIYYDENLGNLNTDSRGKLLGQFDNDDKILVLHTDGNYELRNYEITQRFDPKNIIEIKKFEPKDIISAVCFSGEHQQYFVKRFQVETTTQDKKFSFLHESKNSRLVCATTQAQPQAEITYQKLGEKDLQTFVYDLDILAEVKNFRILGTKIGLTGIKTIKILEKIEIIKEIPKEIIAEIPKEIIVEVVAEAPKISVEIQKEITETISTEIPQETMPEESKFQMNLF